MDRQDIIEEATRASPTQVGKTRDVDPMLFSCWASVEDVGPT